MRLFCRFSNTVEVVAIILDSLDITMNNLLKPVGTKLRSFTGKSAKLFLYLNPNNIRSMSDENLRYITSSKN